MVLEEVIRHILLFQFGKIKKARDVAKRIQDVYGEGIVSESKFRADLRGLEESITTYQSDLEMMSSVHLRTFLPLSQQYFSGMASKSYLTSGQKS